MKNALQHLTKGPTHEECVKKLDLAALDPMDPLFLAAFNIFGVNPGLKESWMLLPEIPEVLKGWLQMTATSLGLIKQVVVQGVKESWMFLLNYLDVFVELFGCFC